MTISYPPGLMPMGSQFADDPSPNLDSGVQYLPPPLYPQGGPGGIGGIVDPQSVAAVARGRFGPVPAVEPGHPPPSHIPADSLARQTGLPPAPVAPLGRGYFRQVPNIEPGYRPPSPVPVDSLARHVADQKCHCGARHGDKRGRHPVRMVGHCGECASPLCDRCAGKRERGAGCPHTGEGYSPQLMPALVPSLGGMMADRRAAFDCTMRSQPTAAPAPSAIVPPLL